jgi:exodeoxyribonuclease VII small subunit
VSAEKAKPPTFEEALGKLEAIVDAMEDGRTPLAEMIAKYEEGNKLLKVCEARLKDAELKIEQLKRTRDGAETVPFETTKGD